MAGAEAVLNAPPDRHAIAFFSIADAVLNAGLIRNPSLDPHTAFTPVPLAVTMPMVLTAGKHIPARTLPEFIELMHARPGGFEIMNLMGIFAHAATPTPVLRRLEQAAMAAVAQPALAQRLRDAGTEPAGTGIDEFRSFWHAQLAPWLPVVEAPGVRLE